MAIIKGFEDVQNTATPNSTDTPHKICVQTRMGRSIPNYRPDPSLDQPLLDRYIWRPQWKRRAPNTPHPHGYNCAGHVWANRRAAIDVRDWSVIQNILDDDNYKQITPDDAMTDDIALYIDINQRALHHVARVISNDQRHGTGILLLSKLGNQFGEVIHSPYDIHFEYEFKIEYWTERLPNKIDI